MTFEEYSEKAYTTAIYPNQGNNLPYAILGVNGEAGELAEKVKKIIRDDNGVISEEKRQEMKKELGDILWYINTTCKELNLTLEEVAQSNLEKISSRKERDKIQGSGDNR